MKNKAKQLKGVQSLGKRKTPPHIALLILLACGIFGILSAANADEPSVKLGVCDWTLGRGGDPGALALASKLGLEGVQVSLNIKGDSLALTDPSLQAAYFEAVRKHNVEIASFAIGELNNLPLKSDPRAETWLEQSIGISKAMGVKVVLVPFFGKGDLKDDPAGVEAVVERLRRVGPKAEEAGVVLALESWLGAADCLDILKRVGSPAVKIYYDVANSQKAGYDVGKEIRLLGGQIAEIHAKDYRDLYGKGSMDFEAVRQAMEDVGYRGWLVIEGSELPLGVEESIRYDAQYLRTLFPAQ